MPFLLLSSVEVAGPRGATRPRERETWESRFQAITRMGTAATGPTTKGEAMYIGGGVLALIVIIVLLIWLL